MSANLDLASIIARIDGLRRDPGRRKELAGLLDETAPIYAGRSASEAERLRAYVLAGFATGPFADEALPFVLEQIDSGHNPFAVAAAGKALRNMKSLPSDAAPRLVHAMLRLRSRDAYVWHGELTNARPDQTRSTMLTELAEALCDVVSRSAAHGEIAAPFLKSILAAQGTAFHPRVLALLEKAAAAAETGGKAAVMPDATRHDCCCYHGEMPRPPMRSAVQQAPLDLALQDQEGSPWRFGDFFPGYRSVAAFFYTRCENPEKCSLTITGLAMLQRLLRADPSMADVKMAAFTYDPAFDTPARLKAYGRDRGIDFDFRTKLFRTVGPLEPLAAYFDLGVSFGPSTVNLHRLELAILDRKAQPVQTVLRRKWQPSEVMDFLAEQVAR